MAHQHRGSEPVAFDGVGDDALLLHEFAHRTANQIAAAAAALHLVKGVESGARGRLIEHAIERLQGFGELNRVLARPVLRRSEVSGDLFSVCRAIASGASGAAASVVSIDAPPTWVDGDTARRLVLVAAELVTNAVRHALDGRAGRLDISLGVEGDEVVLKVADDGRGIRSGAASSGTGFGSGIVAQLVERAHGAVSTKSGPGGTTVRVALPLRTAVDEDPDVAF